MRASALAQPYCVPVRRKNQIKRCMWAFFPSSIDSPILILLSCSYFIYKNVAYTIASNINKPQMQRTIRQQPNGIMLIFRQLWNEWILLHVSLNWLVQIPFSLLYACVVVVVLLLIFPHFYSSVVRFFPLYRRRAFFFFFYSICACFCCCCWNVAIFCGIFSFTFCIYRLCFALLLSLLLLLLLLSIPLLMALISFCKHISVAVRIIQPMM